MSILTNSGKHLDKVLSLPCKKHNAEADIPCYRIFPGTSPGALLFGACGSRIKKAGYNGTISPMSLRLKTPGGRGFVSSSGKKR